MIFVFTTTKVISKRDQLLKHHLVKSFIQRKWIRFGAPVFYSNIVIYGLLMVLLTVYMHIHLDRMYYSNELKKCYSTKTVSI